MFSYHLVADMVIHPEPHIWCWQPESLFHQTHRKVDINPIPLVPTLKAPLVPTIAPQSSISEKHWYTNHGNEPYSRELWKDQFPNHNQMIQTDQDSAPNHPWILWLLRICLFHHQRTLAQANPTETSSNKWLILWKCTLLSRNQWLMSLSITWCKQLLQQLLFYQIRESCYKVPRVLSPNQLLLPYLHIHDHRKQAWNS